MRVLAVENYDNTPLGLVGQALDERGATVELVRAHRGEPLPESPDGYDGMVILGGAQNALADDEYPHLPKLVALTRAFADADRAVLGVCLGSQIIARAYGGDNILHRPIEFGYHTVTPLPDAAGDPVLSVLDGSPAPLFHWHHDTVSLPDGAVHLASSELTPVQAFRVGRKVHAIQFHFEASRAVVADWSEKFAAQILPNVPDWPRRRATEMAAEGAIADKVGLEIARAWTRLAAGD